MPLIQTSKPVSAENEMLRANRDFYEPLWRDSRLIRPERFNTWNWISQLAEKSPRRLEVGPGLRPRLPLAGTSFVDLSHFATGKLRESGANAVTALVSELPFEDASFDLVCAMDIIEHVEDDERALTELARVASPGSTLIISVPLHADRWTPFDDAVGHRRRYDLDTFLEQLRLRGFSVTESTDYGMQPKSSRLVDLGMWFMTHQRERAMWWYNHIFMPLSLHFQSPFELRDGLIPPEELDQILLVCQKRFPLVP